MGEPKPAGFSCPGTKPQFPVRERRVKIICSMDDKTANFIFMSKNPSTAKLNIYSHLFLIAFMLIKKPMFQLQGLQNYI